MKQIFEIFSKSPKQNKQKPKAKIIIDYREKNSLVPSELINLGLEVEFRELKVADYIVKDIAIERKTIHDFANSMINKRLFRQIQELQQYKNRLLLIEGIEEQELYNDENIGINGNAIRGFLLSILLKHRIPILFTKNSEDTAKFILILNKKEEKELALNARKRSLNKKQRLQYILEGFPGVGPKTAQKLLKKFKTIQNIINASEQELRETIGKKAEIILKLSKENY